ncbi:MAG: hypothetical protein KDA96_11475 [Planctomycetaceae bacterium]|nr:hypothetical protein [Planctomycetaceae bacterium]
MGVHHQKLRFLGGVLLGLCLSQSAWGHPEGFSGIRITVREDVLEGAVTLHTRDLGNWFPPGNYPDYVADVSRELEMTVDEVIEIRLDDQILTADSVTANQPEVGLIEVRVVWKLPALSRSAELLVWSKHLYLMPRGHQQLLSVEDRRTVREEQSGVLCLDDVLTIERDAGSARIRPFERQAVPIREETTGEPASDVATAPAATAPESAPPEFTTEVEPVVQQSSPTVSSSKQGRMPMESAPVRWLVLISLLVAVCSGSWVIARLRS